MKKEFTFFTKRHFYQNILNDSKWQNRKGKVSKSSKVAVQFLGKVSIQTLQASDAYFLRLQ